MRKDKGKAKKERKIERKGKASSARKPWLGNKGLLFSVLGGAGIGLATGTILGRESSTAERKR